MTSAGTSALAEGELSIVGRIMPASNHTFLAEIDGLRVVYKPESGERPLWDFTDGTLARREYAARVLSEHIGWTVVPETILRDGPAGPGMVQRWMEPDEDGETVDLVPEGAVPPGWLHVLDATGPEDQPVSLVHRDDPGLRRIALFDLVTNNTDRKAGHLLPMSDGQIFGVDHGICFHVDDKVRTVLWGWAGEPLTEGEVADLERLVDDLQVERSLDVALRPLLTVPEIEATRDRCLRLLRAARLPEPAGEWPPIPWPPF